MDILHALHFNILYALGGGADLPFLGLYDAHGQSMIDRYSDFTFDGSTWKDILTNEEIPEWLNAIKSNPNLFWETLSEEEAMEKNREGSLFGMSYLPWTIYSCQNVDGTYTAHHLYGEDTIVPLNPLRREVLMRKAQTVAILAASAYAVYYGFKYLRRKRYF